MNDGAVELLERENAATLKLRGSLGIAQAGALRQTILRAIHQPKPVSLDLREVSRMEASALQVLMALEAELTRSGRRLKIDPLEGPRRRELAGSGWPVLAAGE